MEEHDLMHVACSSGHQINTRNFLWWTMSTGHGLCVTICSDLLEAVQVVAPSSSKSTLSSQDLSWRQAHNGSLIDFLSTLELGWACLRLQYSQL